MRHSMKSSPRPADRRVGDRPRREATGLTGDQIILAIGGLLLVVALLADVQFAVLMIIAMHTLVFAGSFYVNRLTWPRDGE